jgi:hypothetical protein
MTASSISRAANDPALQARVLAMAHRELIFDEEKAASQFGLLLAAGQTNAATLMYPVAVDTEAAYETAVNSGRGAPGHDVDIITDAALTAAVNAHWPWGPDEGPNAPPEA